MPAAAAAATLAAHYTLDAPVVRMGLAIDDARVLSDLLLAWDEDTCAQIHDKLWLLVVLTEQRRRVVCVERASYDERANRILEQLDPEPPR
ncbi:MAG: hypothetical protein LC798_12130 [Chloroflexi bacterium]|nr:hypothetical protein [Chloroflexota bacterium]